MRPKLGKSFSLHDAQWVLAREYGFDSWPKLKCAVEDRSRSFGEIVSEFVAAAFGGDQKRAAELLEREPEIARADLSAACLGDEYEFVANYAKVLQLLLDAGATPPHELCGDALPAPVLQALTRTWVDREKRAVTSSS